MMMMMVMMMMVVIQMTTTQDKHDDDDEENEYDDHDGDDDGWTVEVGSRSLRRTLRRCFREFTNQVNKPPNLNYIHLL